MAKETNASRSMFEGSVRGFANVAAVLAAFIGTPPAFSATQPWMIDYVEHHYGYGFGDLFSFAWWVCLALAIFFSARMTLSTALVMGGLALAVRFL